MDTTLLTTHMTAAAKIWLLGCGIKPVEEEVPVGASWVADLAGYITPTRTELKRNLRLRHIIETHVDTDSWIDIFLQKYQMPLTVLVEVKASRSDYMKDKERKFQKHRYDGPAHLCYIALPQGMIEENDLLWYWGYLFFSQNGSTLLKVRPPLTIFPQHPGDVVDFIAAVGERCYNKWHGRELRQLMKNYRKKETEDKARWRMTRFLESILQNFGAMQDHFNKGLSFAIRMENQGHKLTDHQRELCKRIDTLKTHCRPTPDL